MHKEKPIPFKAEEVRAILDGRKIQTRRVIKQDMSALVDPTIMQVDGKKIVAFDPPQKPEQENPVIELKCPHGQPGDRLWVRETWTPWVFLEDYKEEELCQELVDYRATTKKTVSHYIWKPSVHMPRWASRITLEITDVKVGRLQEISEEDAVADVGFIADEDPYWAPTYNDPDSGGRPSGVVTFQFNWDETEKPEHQWDSNPWVWVIEFKRLKDE